MAIPDPGGDPKVHTLDKGTGSPCENNWVHHNIDSDCGLNVKFLLSLELRCPNQK
jgi:hypothetical protein